jgi:diguanylate cyclase (GGDEF)-like protein
LIDALAKEVGVSRGLGYFCGGGQLTLREVKGFDGAHAVPLGQAVIDRCELDGAATDNLVILRNFLPQEGAGDDVHEAMCLYIRHKSILQGVIMLFNDPEASLPKEVVPKRITFLLDQAALALDNAGRYNLARDMLYVDELTDLYNYRYLDVVLERELKRAEHCGTCLSVLFLDIDFFKVVNDMYGHLVGSAVLKEMGAILRLSVRDVDAVIRYGGDEYTIVLVETGLPGAELAAERIRTMVEAHTFGNHDGLALKLTVSLGYACWPVDAASKKELMAMADRAMYRGKAGGKNRALHAQSGSGSI